MESLAGRFARTNLEALEIPNSERFIVIVVDPAGDGKPDADLRVISAEDRVDE